MTGVLLGGGLALVVCLVFLLICSVGISGGWVEEDLMYQLSVVGCVIGDFPRNFCRATQRRTGSDCRACLGGVFSY